MSSKAKSTQTAESKGCIDRLPMGTDLLGIDGEQYKHHFSQSQWSVFVEYEDEIVYEQQLQPGTLDEWVDYIETKRGWPKLNYTEESIVDQLAAGLNAGDGR